MALRIPFPDTSWSEKEVNLDGFNFILELKYNSRNDNWYLEIYTLQRALLVGSLKLTPNVNLTSQYRTRLGDNWPEGDLVFLRTKPRNQIGRDTLNSYMLVYMTDNEVEGIEDFIA